MLDRRCHRGLAALLAVSALGAASPVRAQEGWKFGPGPQISRPGSDFTLHLAGYAQGDLRSRRNFTGGDDGEAGLNGTDTLLRRARIGFEGDWKRLSFGAMVDLADDGERLKDLFAEVKLAKALRVRGGHFKVPVSYEWLTSDAKTDFVERSMSTDALAPSRDWGVMATGSPVQRFDYMVGVFEGDGRTERSRAERTLAARVEYGLLGTLDLGASFSQGDVAADVEVEGVDPVPRGLTGAGASQFRFYDPHFVAGRRQRLGADARGSAGPVAVRGEWLRATERREGQGPVFEDLPEEIGEGWVGSLTWLVTGEKKTRTVRPARPLSRGGPGAIEIGARFDSLRFDDRGAGSGFAVSGNRARNIRPASARAFTGGLSWWPESWIRLMGNVVLERFEDALRAAEPGRQGQYVTILGRLQVALP
jgi:phosphate-selective porin OprO/OprP